MSSDETPWDVTRARIENLQQDLLSAVTPKPTPAIQSQGRMRKPRSTDRDEPLRNDVAGMIADLLPGGQDLHGPVIASVAHQIVVVVRERVLRELESYARENIR